jgi:hypothetical protein
MNKKDLTILIVIGVIFVGLMSYVFINKNGVSKPSPSSTSTEQVVSTTPQRIPTSTSATSTKVNKNNSKTTSSPGAATPEYMAALNTYRNSGYYFQLSNCSANPGSLTMKKGSRFMIDNRDNKAHRVTIGSKVITIQGYGFAIVNADKIGTNNITCD